MRRVAVGVVGVLVTVTLLAAGLKWHGLRRWRASAAAEMLRTAAQRPSRSQSASLHGLGTGPPPSGIEAPQGARMLHGGPTHTARAGGRAPVSSPVTAWSHPVGGPVEAQVTTSLDGRTLYVSSLGGSLTALGVEDGAERWSIALGDRVYSTPYVGPDGTIYVGSDAHRMFAISAEGKVRWTLDTDGDADTGPAPSPSGEVVFAAGRMVYAVAPSGQIAWRFAAKRKVFTSPAIAQSGRVFFGSQDHHAYALSAEGTLVWSTDLGADVDGAPAIGDDGAVFVGTDGDEVVRLDPDRGSVVWRAPVGGYVRGTLSVARNGDVLAGVYGPAPREVRVRAADGEVVGQFAVQGTGARDFGVHGGALEDDAGDLLFGTQDDDVYAVGPTGELLWRFATGGDVDAPLTLLPGGRLVVASDDGNVYLLRSP